MTNDIQKATEDCIMPFPICPTCGAKIDLDRETYQNYTGEVTCRHCRRRMAVTISYGELHECRSFVDPDLKVPWEDVANYEENEWIIPLHWLAYQEAFTCLEGGAFRAAAVMCRLAMEHALRELGVPEGDTAKMIAYANGHGILQGKYKHMARSVGFFGGKGAHAQYEEIYKVEQTEATHGLRVVRGLLLVLFPIVK